MCPPRGRLGLGTMREAQCCGHGVVLQKGVGQGGLTAAATGTRIVGVVGKGPTPVLATAQGKETVLSCSCPALAVLAGALSALCPFALYVLCPEKDLDRATPQASARLWVGLSLEVRARSDIFPRSEAELRSRLARFPAHVYTDKWPGR